MGEPISRKKGFSRATAPSRTAKGGILAMRQAHSRALILFRAPLFPTWGANQPPCDGDAQERRTKKEKTEE